jgi:cytochrome c biogenesis factor
MNRWHRVKDWLIQAAAALLFWVGLAVLGSIMYPYTHPAWEYFSNGHHFFLKLEICAALFLLYLLCARLSRREGDYWEMLAVLFVITAFLVFMLGVILDEPTQYDA